MKKISVVVPCYGTEQYVEKCIRSLFEQTYSNIEIIAVNDCSKGNMKEILQNLAKEDKRLKVVDNKVNKGLFHTRIIGSENATGDYISFVDSDDYVDNDYYRLLLNKAENDKCDIVMANYVRENNNVQFIAGLSFTTNDSTYEGKEFYDKFFNQTGRNIRYHMLCTKLISMDVWKSLLKVVSKVEERIVMTEDLAFSSIALYYAKRVGFCDNAIYYYVNNEKQSTNSKDITIGKINKNIHDINTVFDFIISFLNENKLYKKYEQEIKIWRGFYLSMHINIYKRQKKKNKNYPELDFKYKDDEDVNNFYELEKKDKSWDNFHELKTAYDQGFNEIKKKIIDKNIKVVSFDMFDTLVYRPFFTPSDIFYLLNKMFNELFSPIKAVKFSKIRKDSECELRNINYQKGIKEVTLDGIYEYIAKTYCLDEKKLNIIKAKEMEMEVAFCKRRNSGFELYDLAKHLKKKVILTSDIYIPEDIIIKILKNNGYEFDEIYLSSNLLKTKASGDMFEYVIEKEKTKDIIHIGDNYISDVENPKKFGLESAQLYKATDVMMGYTNKKVRYCGNLYKHFVSFNHDHISYEENYGVRASLAIIANYYFDNPFRPFNEHSDFNGDPYFIGYYALGMQTIAICKWLLNDAKKNKIDSIAFMARDGYLPYEATKIYSNIIKKYNDIKLNYTYVSRKALMPLTLRDKNGISLIDTYLNFDMLTPRDLLKQISCIIKYDSKIENKLEKTIDLDKKFESLSEFNKTLSYIYDECFDKKKYDDYYKICKDYFNDNFSGNSATFDIGYSGKPEAIISTVIEKPVTTYFIHANGSDAFNYTKSCDSELKTFYDYKPTLTGTTRELFISSTDPSCVGYELKNKKVQPVFQDAEKYNCFNINMINKIQKGALDFVTKFCEFFKDYIEEMDLNKYYMSVPLEYYYHYVQMEDRLPTKNLLFEDNVNHYVEMNSFIFNRYKSYAAEYSLGLVPRKISSDPLDYELSKYRINRVLYYIVNDRKKLKYKWNKWKNKSEEDNELPGSRSKRIIYYMIFDRKTLMNKIFKKKNNSK